MSRGGAQYDLAYYKQQMNNYYDRFIMNISIYGHDRVYAAMVYQQTLKDCQALVKFLAGDRTTKISIIALAGYAKTITRKIEEGYSKCLSQSGIYREQYQVIKWK